MLRINLIFKIIITPTADSSIRMKWYGYLDGETKWVGVLKDRWGPFSNKMKIVEKFLFSI